MMVLFIIFVLVATSITQSGSAWVSDIYITVLDIIPHLFQFFYIAKALKSQQCTRKIFWKQE